MVCEEIGARDRSVFVLFDSLASLFIFENIYIQVFFVVESFEMYRTCTPFRVCIIRIVIQSFDDAIDDFQFSIFSQ